PQGGVAQPRRSRELLGDRLHRARDPDRPDLRPGLRLRKVRLLPLQEVTNFGPDFTPRCEADPEPIPEEPVEVETVAPEAADITPDVPDPLPDVAGEAPETGQLTPDPVEEAAAVVAAAAEGAGGNGEVPEGAAVDVPTVEELC